MSSTYDTGSGGSTPQGTRAALDRETQSAREQLGTAGEQIRDGAKGAYEQVKDRAASSAEDGKAAVTGSLDDFTAAIKRASDELGERDQSMAANLVRQAAGGLEQASEALKGRSLPELAGSVADFARRQPGAFLIGAALAGVALGRFARASGDHASLTGTTHRGGDAGTARGYGSDRSRTGAGGTGANPYGSAGQLGGAGERDRFERGGTGSYGSSHHSSDEADRRAGTGAGGSSFGTSTPGGSTYGGTSTGASVAGGSPSIGSGTPSPGGSNAAPTDEGTDRANDAQLNRFGASGSTDTTKLPGSQETNR